MTSQTQFECGGVQETRCGLSHRHVEPCSKRRAGKCPEMPREARPALKTFSAWRNRQTRGLEVREPLSGKLTAHAGSTPVALNNLPKQIVSSTSFPSSTSLASALVIFDLNELPTMTGAVGATGKSSSSETGISRSRGISRVYRSERLPGKRDCNSTSIVEKAEGVSAGNLPRTSVKPDMWLLKNTAESHRPFFNQ